MIRHRKLGDEYASSVRFRAFQTSPRLTSPVSFEAVLTGGFCRGNRPLASTGNGSRGMTAFLGDCFHGENGCYQPRILQWERRSVAVVSTERTAFIGY